MNEYIVSAEQDGMRLDVFLTEQMEGSRSYIQSLIKGGHVTVGAKVGKANLRLTPNAVVRVEVQMCIRDRRMYAGFATAEESNKRYRYLIESGATGLSCAFDLPTQIGYDSDDAVAEGEVGKVCLLYTSRCV